MKKTISIVAGISVVVGGCLLAVWFVARSRAPAPQAEPTVKQGATAVSDAGPVPVVSSQIEAAVASATRVDRRLQVSAKDAHALGKSVVDLLRAYNQDTPSDYEGYLGGHGLKSSVTWNSGKTEANWVLVTQSMRGATIDPSAVVVTTVRRTPSTQFKDLIGTPNAGSPIRFSSPKSSRGENDPAFAESGTLAVVKMPGHYKDWATRDLVPCTASFFFARSEAGDGWTLVGTTMSGMNADTVIQPPPAR